MNNGPASSPRHKRNRATTHWNTRTRHVGRQKRGVCVPEDPAARLAEGRLGAFAAGKADAVDCLEEALEADEAARLRAKQDEPFGKRSFNTMIGYSRFGSHPKRASGQNTAAPF